MYCDVIAFFTSFHIFWGKIEIAIENAAQKGFDRRRVEGKKTFCR